MKIRLVSDLHLDINHAFPLDFEKEGLEDVFTIAAGDISGSPEKAAEWLKKNVKHGAFVSGNHDVYDTDLALEDIKKMFAEQFPLDSDVTYFDYDVGVISKEIGENLLLVADVMYTDYRLPVIDRNPDGDIKSNMRLADPWRNGRYGMNDFNYGKCLKTYDGINDKNSRAPNRLVPERYLEHHEHAFKAVTETIESNKDKEVILVTHHCLSPKCIDSEHERSSVVASYVSDKDDWIASHPNIKCVCSGHIHTRRTFNVGNALYVMNALGYCREHYMQWSGEAKAQVPWTPDCIIDTSTWTVEFKPHPMPEWKRKYDIHNAEVLKYMNCFL